MANQIYAFDLSGTYHEVAESKPTAGIGLSVLGICGHIFLARKVVNEPPEIRQMCMGCRGVEEKSRG
jgi:hypothetical protein